MELIFYFMHYSLVMLFGTFLTISFTGITFNKKNIPPIIIYTILSGILQLTTYLTFNEYYVRLVYPVITHLPLLIFLHLYFHKRLSTGIVSITCSYLCCQPANWVGIIAQNLINNDLVEHIASIITLILSFVIFNLAKTSLAEIYNKETKSVLIFGIVPIVYYIYDYSMAIYTNFWEINNRIVIEFLPLFICIIYMIFCLVYYKEEELKKDAIRNEQILLISLDQQSKEIESIKENENRMKILRHDLRLLLNNLLYSVENNDKDTSLSLIKQYIKEVDNTVIRRFCENDTINYVLSNYSNKCINQDIIFDVKILIDEITIDNLLFSSILSNALDNAYNAQLSLPKNKRKIIVRIKQQNGKLLLSVKNPYIEKPKFVNGIPISKNNNHGYGTQSIQYVTKRLNGVYQFTVQNEYFLLRVII